MTKKQRVSKIRFFSLYAYFNIPSVTKALLGNADLSDEIKNIRFIYKILEMYPQFALHALK